MFNFLKRKKKPVIPENEYIRAGKILDEFFGPVTYQDPPDYDHDAALKRLREERAKLKKEAAAHLQKME